MPIKSKKKTKTTKPARTKSTKRNSGVQERIVAKKKSFLEVLKKKAGNVSLACDAVGITRQTFYEWKKDDVDFVNGVDDVQEYLLDYSESKLMEKISEGSETSIIFHLKTKGKSRGYTEKTEVQHSGEIIVELPTEMTE
ncbi:MAG TPA: hypothetical protein PLI74_13810 [Candidatus Kapabacteria bacterium]|nr:hypothetical protein [Candidatus Kapabacteria bacterium]